MSINLNRVTFYSVRDLSSTRNLENSESIIQNFSPKGEFEINDTLELYHIKLYFDNNLYLNRWAKDEKEKYIRIVGTFWETIRKFFIKLNSDNITKTFREIEFQYYESFWDLINRFNVYKNIQSTTLKEIMSNPSFYIRHLLKQKNIVLYFSSLIKSYLMEYSKSAEILLSHYELYNQRKNSKLFFPPSLTGSDKENIISNYLDKTDPNLNYIRLIVNSKHLKLSDRIRLKAKKLSKKINDEYLNNDNSFSHRFQVSISKDQEEISRVRFENNISEYSYSENWLNSTSSPPDIFQNFKDLFGFINYQGCIELVNKKHESDSFEDSLMRSKNDYHTGFSFNKKNILSNVKLFTYSKYLKENHNTSIEDVLSYQVNHLLNKNFDIKDFKMNLPSENTSFAEKIRFLSPEMEFVLKQYNSYIEEGFIDFELLQISSKPLNLGQVKSKVKNKYAYGIGEKTKRLKFSLFSPNSMLNYIDPYKNKYKNFYYLIKSEKVIYNTFQDYQKKEIELLLNENILSINKDDIISIKNYDFIIVIGKLYYEEVINLWHYKTETRRLILQMERDGLITFDNALFSNEERRYLNYYLNKKEFTNGLDLRNKYLHGTNSSSKLEQENDYYIFLKIFILIIHKIKDDLYLFKKSSYN